VLPAVHSLPRESHLGASDAREREATTSSGQLIINGAINSSGSGIIFPPALPGQETRGRGRLREVDRLRADAGSGGEVYKEHCSLPVLNIEFTSEVAARRTPAMKFTLAPAHGGPSAAATLVRPQRRRISPSRFLRGGAGRGGAGRGLNLDRKTSPRIRISERSEPLVPLSAEMARQRGKEGKREECRQTESLRILWYLVLGATGKIDRS